MRHQHCRYPYNAFKCSLGRQLTRVFHTDDLNKSSRLEELEVNLSNSTNSPISTAHLSLSSPAIILQFPMINPRSASRGTICQSHRLTVQSQVNVSQLRAAVPFGRPASAEDATLTAAVIDEVSGPLSLS